MLQSVASQATSKHSQKLSQCSSSEIKMSEPGGFRLIIEHVVMCVFGVPAYDLQTASRGRANVALARQTAMYLAHVGCSLSLTEVGTLFERDRTTVAHACALIEDRRDNPDFDRALELLERAVRALRQPPRALTQSAA